MSETRVIKKYPNRRLYDTEESRYITLSDIRKLVNDQVEFAVIEKKTGNDITCQILLQVITEQETHGNTVLNRNFLSQIINSYGSNVQGMVGGYLEQSMNMFMQQRKQMRERIKNVLDMDPTGIASKNYTRWLALQDEVISKFSKDKPVKEKQEEE
ncbi:MAG: polyhydroxyalkanoate synthesis repressor PhaR [Gammaproteobacteria bacterium]|nr:polyhydroxyalkanoate synthesis repressor PhaR [Gammaproteobacteria bacterium]NNC98058.1 polyhydroxyalkanoate synthesis repressor PhaR [Gammaproteobacteria bacterium]NNM14608.1 polyhydroxyalkanoate synthesis repressor PhaR [Gammaproteobacteria bacterium]